MPQYEHEYDRRRIEVIESLVPAGSGPAADIGCHEGVTTAILAKRGYDPLGVDLDAEAVARARRLHPELTFEAGSLERLAGRTPWNLVLCLEVIEHIAPADQQGFLDDVRAVVGDGGTLILSTPGRYSLMSLYERARRRARGEGAYDWWDPTHVGIVSFRTLRRMLHNSGFVVDDVTGFYFAPERLSPPFALRGPVGRAGWDLILRARAMRPATPPR